jgi:hypothetical protein
VYSRTVNGQVTEFGTSGFLYRSNKLMYDRATNTLWRQFIGEPVVGPLAFSGIQLKLFPVTVTTWEQWLEEHPNTTVLDIQTGIYTPDRYLPESDPSSIYHLYREDAGTMFPVPLESDLLATKAEVFGLLLGGEARAYALDSLTETLVVNDTLGGGDVVIITDPKAGAARAYESGGHTFSVGEGSMIVDENGTSWVARDDALVQDDDPSQELPRLDARNAYWFGWSSNHPDTSVYED